MHGAEVTLIPQRPRRQTSLPPSREHDICLRVVGDVTREQVLAWCETRLSAYKQPTELEIAAY